MQFHNRLLETEGIADPCDRLPFYELKEGERYKHTPDGPVSQVIEVGSTFRTIMRNDGWLIPAKEGCFLWDKMVIKVAPVRK